MDLSCWAGCRLCRQLRIPRLGQLSETGIIDSGVATRAGQAIGDFDGDGNADIAGIDTTFLGNTVGVAINQGIPFSQGNSLFNQTGLQQEIFNCLGIDPVTGLDPLILVADTQAQADSFMSIFSS